MISKLDHRILDRVISGRATVLNDGRMAKIAGDKGLIVYNADDAREWAITPRGRAELEEYEQANVYIKPEEYEPLARLLRRDFTPSALGPRVHDGDEPHLRALAARGVLWLGEGMFDWHRVATLTSAGQRAMKRFKTTHQQETPQ